MAATITLATTTLTQAVASANDTQVLPASLTGVVPGVFLYIERELLRVVSAALPGGWVSVLRGQDGTSSTPHAAGATVFIGTGDQFYDRDPMGLPLGAVYVSPWVNVRSGAIWVPQGDEEGAGANARYWRQVTTTYTFGDIPSRVATQNPTIAGVAT